MALDPGTRLGPYEIVSTLGAGGMGEVYRARDAKLNRDVAIKVLPALLAPDADRLARFEREAQVLASLNHPHIAHVYGVIDEPPALVMELVDGDDLAERIAHGALPVREALEIGRQIADALDAAHGQGIVHRDLKPANVKIRADGTVKVLDFGLAKAVDPGAFGSTVHPLNSPTITSPAALTRMGVILGTAAYMAPEQAKGKPVDRGADMWAFGVVLFEMLSGRMAFDGETITDVLAAIVTRDPDWTALPADTPAGIRRLLRRCLDRDRRKRLADAGEARYQIEEVLGPSSGADTAATPPAPRVTRLSPWVPWMVAAALAVLAALLWRQPASPVSSAVARYSIEPPARAVIELAARSGVAISPDGQTIVIAATSEGVPRLFVRERGSFELRSLDGTAAASHPVISPDGRWIAFFNLSKLNKMPIGGGPVTALADVSDPRGLSWDADDTILFTPSTVSGVQRISPGGGSPVAVTTPVDKLERTHRWPQLLPGGRAVLFTVGSFASPDNYDAATVEAQTLPGNERKVLLTGASMARYIESGHLVFGRGRSLFAVPFDLETLTVTGAAVTVLQGIAGDATTGVVHLSVARNGTIAYVPASAEAETTRLSWVDRNGRVETLPMPASEYSDPSVSPDGRRLAVSVIAGGGRDIWVHDFERKTFTKLTFGGQNLTPVWSSDSRWVYFVSRRTDGTGSAIHRRPADGSSESEVLVPLPNTVYLNFVTADGRTAVFDNPPGTKGSSDISRIALVKGAVAEPIISTPVEEFGSRLSRDGRWLAYQSLESGRLEIYVRAFDGTGGRWQVSTGGGEEPRWSADGRELYFRSGGLLMAVPILQGSTFEAGTPVELFSGVYSPRADTGLSYDVHGPSGRLIMIRPSQQGLTNNLVRVVEHWFAELPR